ncbi:MAG: minor capsid protein [Candidatus Cloacimonetes bacterium]|nr:minor capsid protein [Candidatus Cloacimonadota bacterium]
MDNFLEKLISYLSVHNVAPALIQASDVDREKSYLFDLPGDKDDPDDVFVFNNYHTSHASATAKNVGIKYVQVIVRASSQQNAHLRIFTLYKFLLEQSDVDQVDGNIRYLDSDTWVIFDCNQGPIKIKIDEQGRHIWGLSFPVKTNLF